MSVETSNGGFTWVSFWTALSSAAFFNAHESDSCVLVDLFCCELRTLGEAVRHETGPFAGDRACEALNHRHHGQNWKFQGQLNFPLGMKGFVADRQEIRIPRPSSILR